MSCSSKPYVGQTLNSAAVTPPPFQRETTRGFVLISFYRNFSEKVRESILPLFPNNNLRSFLCGIKHQHGVP